MKLKKTLSAGSLGLLFLLLLAIPFVLRPTSEKLEVDRELIAVSPHWEGIRIEFDRAFREHWLEKTGEAVGIRWLDLGGTSDALKFVLGEFQREPDGIGVDIFWGGGVDPHERMRDEKLLDPYKIDEDILKEIPPRLFGYYLYDPGFQWYGTALSGFGIVFNKKVLEFLDLPVPTTWEDLGRPELFTWIGTGDPANSGTSHTMYEFILQGYGFEKGVEIITLMAANARQFDQHSSNVSREVALGEMAYGLSIDFYAGAAIADAGPDKIGFVFPERLTVVNPDPISIFKGAPNRDLAEAFIDFILSEKGQTLWLLPAGVDGGPTEYDLMRVPVRPKLFDEYLSQSAITYNPFKLEGTLDYKQSFGSRRWTILNDFLRASVVETHDPLTKAWAEIRILPVEQRQAWVERLTKPVISEKEMFELVEEKWDDPIFRNKKRSEWARAYRKRYETIANEVRSRTSL